MMAMTVVIGEERTPLQGIKELEGHPRPVQPVAQQGKSWVKIALAVAGGAILIGGGVTLFCMLHHKRDETAPTLAPTTAQPTTMPPDPYDACQYIYGNDTYLTPDVDALFQNFSTYLAPIELSICNVPGQRPKEVIKLMTKEVHEMAHAVANLTVAAACKTAACAPRIKILLRDLTFNCLAGSNTERIQTLFQAWSDNYPQTIPLFTLQQGAYSCLQGICRRAGWIASFVGRGGYICSDIFQGLSGTATRIANILSW